VTFEPDQTVYLSDGREAIYVLNYFDTHLVRVVYHYEGGHDEPPYSYPEDKITHAARVFAKPPVEVYDKEILKLKGEVERLREKAVAVRNEIADAAKNKTAMEKAAAKYPCIQQALDFIEGRITHVVRHGGYDGAEILTLKDAFEQVDRWGGGNRPEGMKLLNLFGTDEHGRNVAWGLNEYRDGSGSTRYTIWPARGETEARETVRVLFKEAINAWRAHEKVADAPRRIGIQATLDKNPWLEAPDDWLKHQADHKAEQRAAKIAKLRAEIEKLEAEE
jgi:hypothetical protein